MAERGGAASDALAPEDPGGAARQLRRWGPVVVGVALWAWRLFALDDPENRRRFLTDGRLQLPT